MEALLDFLNSVRIGVTERLTSPLLGNFVISWCVWNYRLFVTLLSDGKLDEKFNYIDKTLYPGADALWAAGLIPFGASLFLIYAYPFAARYVYEHRLKVNKDLMERRRKVQDTEPMDMEQARKLREDLREREKHWQARIAEVEQENTDLRQELEVARTRKGTTHPPASPNRNAPVSGTTKTIAAKLGVRSGKQLIIAAAAQLTFVEKKHTFSRQEILNSMRAATGYFRVAFANNLTKYLDQLIAEQVLIETASNEFALKEDYRSELEVRLSS